MAGPLMQIFLDQIHFESTVTAVLAIGGVLATVGVTVAGASEVLRMIQGKEAARKQRDAFKARFDREQSYKEYREERLREKKRADSWNRKWQLDRSIRKW